ncbi:hypothetical protein [Methanosarcina sp. 2.H.A.1B.4]|uniref:hypothetical protein n=1 Tax=Methanosarcina sp. 2.H.A.1B.4 TaxID=1483600 RepID=UPI00062181C3|nr:hypothetical protein [Methanosarcina sp. 2.H.A.1B.4]KKG13077.1 hypothetical protein EO92_07885 [Methanosarcina sp. 2.H.A.1B.4]
MSCGLSEDERLILKILYTNRNLASNRGYNSKLLERVVEKKISSSYGDTIKKLKNGGYIAQINKKDLKYYIPSSSIPAVCSALDSHGFSVTKGRTRKL